MLQASTKETEVTLNGIFPNALELSYLEAALVQMLKRNNPEVFNGLKDFYKLFPDFYLGQLLCFEEEVQFYISFLDFKERTERYGYSLEMPEISKDKVFYGNGVYDIALVWKNADKPLKTLVMRINDFSKDTQNFHGLKAENIHLHHSIRIM